MEVAYESCLKLIEISGYDASYLNTCVIEAQKLFASQMNGKFMHVLCISKSLTFSSSKE
jgi:hypothetical protein